MYFMKTVSSNFAGGDADTETINDQTKRSKALQLYTKYTLTLTPKQKKVTDVKILKRNTVLPTSPPTALQVILSLI